MLLMQVLDNTCALGGRDTWTSFVRPTLGRKTLWNSNTVCSNRTDQYNGKGVTTKVRWQKDQHNRKVLQMKGKKDYSPISEDSTFAGKSFIKEESPEGNPSPAAVSLQMKSKRGGARLHPFWSHRWIAFTCAPRADLVLSPGAQSVVQAVIQQFPYTALRKISLPEGTVGCVCIDVCFSLWVQLKYRKQ